MTKRLEKKKNDMRGRTKGARRNQFKKGTSGNTYRVTEDIKAVRGLIRTEFMRLAKKYFFADAKSLDSVNVKKIKDLTNAELGMINIWRSICRGDEKKFEWILSRTIGKVKEELEITSDETISKQNSFDFSKISTDEFKIMYKILINARSNPDNQ